jgi:uncharacterized protein (DUF362 family)
VRNGTFYERIDLTSKVAIVKFDDNTEAESLEEALRLIDGIEDLNTPERTVVVKVGVFSHKADNHTSISFVDAIINSLDKAPRIFLVESDNYQGTGLERLQIWKELFSERVVPVTLSDLKDAQDVTLAGQEMKLSNVLFKPNVLVNTHILRTFERGSILKNLFGCVPIRKKAKFHKTEIFCSLLADIYEAIGGVDLSVMDGTYLWRGAGDLRVRMNTLLVGRDAVAVETVGAILAGLKPERMPVTQEFVKRGLGVGNIEEIEIVGTPLESLREEAKLATKTLRKKWKERGGAPSVWAPTIDSLIEDGIFKLPNKRTRKEVVRAFEARGISTKGNTGMIITTLTRRVKKGKLKAGKEPSGWVYWTE